jgi:hypothetical protein
MDDKDPQTDQKLREVLAAHETRYIEAMARGDDVAAGGAASAYLTSVIAFFEYNGTARGPLLRVLRTFEMLGLLHTAMRERTKQYRDALLEKHDLGDVELEHAGTQLAHVLGLLDDQRIDAVGLHRLNAALVDLKMTGRLAAMFKRPRASHRPSDPLTVQSKKAQVARAVRFLMDGCMSRDQAITWLSRKTKLPKSRVKGWYDGIGGQKGTPLERSQYLTLGRMLERALRERQTLNVGIDPLELRKNVVLDLLKSRAAEVAPTYRENPPS